MEHSVIGACVAAENLGNLATSEATVLPYSSSRGPIDKGGDKLRLRMAKPFELRAARSSRCEESLR
jgi:hypothetical protein